MHKGGPSYTSRGVATNDAMGQWLLAGRLSTTPPIAQALLSRSALAQETHAAAARPVHACGFYVRPHDSRTIISSRLVLCLAALSAITILMHAPACFSTLPALCPGELATSQLASMLPQVLLSSSLCIK